MALETWMLANTRQLSILPVRADYTLAMSTFGGGTAEPELARSLV